MVVGPAAGVTGRKLVEGRVAGDCGNERLGVVVRGEYAGVETVGRGVERVTGAAGRAVDGAGVTACRWGAGEITRGVCVGIVGRERTACEAVSFLKVEVPGTVGLERRGDSERAVPMDRFGTMDREVTVGAVLRR